ncbi:hypothetical protein JT358_14800 [Micrococcales bacterium 31B]|nr:hypothetical protein [Micrococcales bacterium 31B]
MESSEVECALHGQHAGRVRHIRVTATDEVIAEEWLCEAHLTQQSFTAWRAFDYSAFTQVGRRARKYGTDVENPLSEDEFNNLIRDLDEASWSAGLIPERAQRRRTP